MKRLLTLLKRQQQKVDFDSFEEQFCIYFENVNDLNRILDIMNIEIK